MQNYCIPLLGLASFSISLIWKSIIICDIIENKCLSVSDEGCLINFLVYFICMHGLQIGMLFSKPACLYYQCLLCFVICIKLRNKSHC